MSFELLPNDLLCAVCAELDPADICNLASTCRALSTRIDSDAAGVWRTKTIQVCGDRDSLILLLIDSGLQLNDAQIQPLWLNPPKNSNASATDESGDFERLYSWKQVFRQMTEAASNAATSKDENAMDLDSQDEAPVLDRETLEAESILEKVRSDLHAWRAEPSSIQVLQDSSVRVLRVIAAFPTHEEAYFLLAFICFIINKLEAALAILELSSAMCDEPYEPAETLADEIRDLLTELHGDESANEAPLINDDGSLSVQLITALNTAFAKYDGDNDGLLTPLELSRLLFATNGAKPSLMESKQICMHFNAQFDAQNASRFTGSSVRLTCAAFIGFYAHQTNEDPAETRKDLDKLGFDPRTLQLKN